jgi:hypothetical protein
MKLFLLLCLVVLVAGLITCQLVEMANMQPIQHRPEGLPERATQSTTNAVLSPIPAGSTLNTITNAEIYIEADVERSYDLSDWRLLGHLDILMPEEDGASGSASFSSPPVTLTLSASISAHADGPITALSMKQPHWHVPRPPPAAFYRLNNLQTWRHEFYTVTISGGPAQ